MWKTLSSQLTSSTDDKNHVCWEVTASHEMQYKIIFQQNLFDLENNKLIDCFQQTNRVLMIIDNNIYQRYHSKILSYFSHHALSVSPVVLNAGEENKTLHLYTQIIDEFIHFKPNRRKEPILIIGGGVLTDVACFAAATYKRGIPIIRIPTTLMGMIDAAIGVKCAINYELKNLLGAYHPGRETFIDPIFLSTLPSIHLRNGIAEIIKMALICSPVLFKLCETHIVSFYDRINDDGIIRIIILAIEEMLKELVGNLYEYNLERAVDFGHTWSPELELSSKPLLHGYAVNVDMAYSLCIAEAMNFLSSEDVDRVYALMRRVELPLTHPLMQDENFIRKTLTGVIQHRGGQLNLPLPKSIGSCIFLKEYSEKLFKQAHQLYCARIKRESYVAA